MVALVLAYVGSGELRVRCRRSCGTHNLTDWGRTRGAQRRSPPCAVSPDKILDQMNELAEPTRQGLAKLFVAVLQTSSLHYGDRRLDCASNIRDQPWHCGAFSFFQRRGAKEQMEERRCSEAKVALDK